MAGDDFNSVAPRERDGVLDQAGDYVSEAWNDPNSRFNRGREATSDYVSDAWNNPDSRFNRGTRAVTDQFNERTKDTDWANVGATFGISAFIGLAVSNLISQPLSQTFFGQSQGAQFAALAMTIGAVALAWNSKTTGDFVSGLRDDIARGFGSETAGAGRDYADLEAPSLPDELEAG